MRDSLRKKSIIIFALILLFSTTHRVFAQSDTTTSKKVNFSIYPALGYQLETSFVFGVISFIVYEGEGQEHDEYYRPSTISPYFLYSLNNQILIAIDFDHFSGMDISSMSSPGFTNTRTSIME
jgi:hypothetical protein